MQYRADISGLRAVAVIPVVLFHADPRLVPGGFVGVDVFFVISGFLITSLIAQDMAQGRFSLAHFYDRRVRRILPAYVLMALVTTLAALVLFPPRMLTAFGESLKYASVFLANQHFLSTIHYFNPGAIEQPLLHVWSLAVEEQFYLLWPLLLMVISHPRLAKARPYVVAALFAISLAVATRNAVLRPERAFFNFNGRAWELLLGASLGLGLLPALKSQRTAELLAALGLALIAGACAFFGEGMIFPGVSALVPTLGALFILWAGTDGRTTRVGRLLGREPMAWIGLISYSLYLWHWPLIAFVRLYLGPDLSLFMVAVLVLASVALAALSWRFVEVPLRRGGLRQRGGEARSIATGVAALAVLVGVGWLLAASGGLPGRASAGARAAETEAVTTWPPRPHCLVLANVDRPPADCRFGATEAGAPRIALWGDSYGNQHGPAVDALAREEGFGVLQMTKAACAPGERAVTGFGAHRVETEVCERFRAAALAQILADPTIRMVVIAGAWRTPTPEDPTLPRLQEAVDRITASGRGVILMARAVWFENGGGRCIVRRRFLGLSDEGCAVTRTEATQSMAAVETALARIAHSSPLVRLVILHPRQCAGDICLPTVDGRIAMSDNGHLNSVGSLTFLGDLTQALDSLRPLLPPAPTAQ